MSCFVSKSVKETQKAAYRLASLLKKRDIVCLEGDLGTGKTTFSKALIHALTSISPHKITSPTFTYLNIYEAGDLQICHFDLYLIRSLPQFLEAGFLDFLQDPSTICCIEWPELLYPFLSRPLYKILFSHEQNQNRRVEIICPL